ncbi:hypothetical protein V8G54_032261 [Vigna mungo]|uniref:Uncharacterized protein n=1 Tax=Vigna mungo TaxID=3915 RepID=A0AAQ3MLV3_VIGMU
MVAAAPEFQEIKCLTTSVIVYFNPSFIDSHYAFNFDDDNSNSLMSDDCMNASVDISECVCEPYDHNYTDADFEKLVVGFRELAVIHSNVTNSAFSIDRVHIPAISVFYDCTNLNALLNDESDAYDDRFAVFDDVKVDMADFENACTDLGLELDLSLLSS